jgi:uncharacterized protein (UPF0371 family)
MDSDASISLRIYTDRNGTLCVALRSDYLSDLHAVRVVEPGFFEDVFRALLQQLLRKLS